MSEYAVADGSLFVMDEHGGACDVSQEFWDIMMRNRYVMICVVDDHTALRGVTDAP